MVSVTRMNGTEFLINGALVELVESTPDTVITLMSGRKYVVREEAAEVAERVTRYFQAIGLVGTGAKSWRVSGADER